MYMCVASLAAIRQRQSFHPPSEEDEERRCYSTEKVWQWKLEGLVSNLMRVRSSWRNVGLDDRS